MDNNYLKLTRVNEYLHILVFIFPLIFFISPDNLFSSLTIIVFLANLLLTSFGYAINDIEDAEDDYYDLIKRKRNPIANNDLNKRKSYLFSLILMIGGLFLLYKINLLVFSLGIIFALVGFLYSWKPIRLKSVPFLDLISHVIFLGLIQFLITYLSFRSLDSSIIPFLMIIIPFSMINELYGEILDYNIDKNTNINNTIQRLQKDDAKKLLMVLSIFATIGFSIMIITIPPENKIMNLFISLITGIIAIFRLYTRINLI
jgi:4-hydroxybenzoate polyprenyltransferase